VRENSSLSPHLPNRPFLPQAARELATSHLHFPAWLALVIVMAIVIAVIASIGH
jgi:hypothetical protein